MKIVDSNPSVDLGLRSEPEDESSSIIQQVKTDVNLILERLIGHGAAQLEASRREWNEERDLWTERCCRLESKNQALQDVAERQEEEKKQLAIDYERKLRDKDKEISKLMTLNKLSLPTIPEISGNSAAMQNRWSSLKIDVKEKKTPRQKDNGVGEERRTRLPKLPKARTYISTPRDDAATSVMVTSLSSRPGVAGVSLASSYPPPGGHQRGVITELSHGQRHSDRSRPTPSVSVISPGRFPPINGTAIKP